MQSFRCQRNSARTENQWIACFSDIQRMRDKDMENKSEEARQLFLSGANCAQAVLGAFYHECGLDYDTAMRLTSGFGGGMGRLREVCGAVSGMFMVASLIRGTSDFSDKAAKDAHYALIQELAAEFRKETGSVICRELLGLTRKQEECPVSETRTTEYYKRRPCVEMVALAARILEEKLASKS